MGQGKTRQLYNLWAVYASVPPATGFLYTDYLGEGHNNPELSLFDTNLLQQIDRVNSFNYSFNVDRTNLTQLGKRDLIDNVIVNRPSVQVGFDYWMIDVKNESRLGFAVNYPDVWGNPISNEEICFIRNFTGQQTDYRNLFVAVSPDNGDLRNRINDRFSPFYGEKELNPSGLFVYGFGNCYINSYQVNLSVGNIPRASVGYICDNVMGFLSGSGVSTPAVLPKSGNIVPDVKFTIPPLDSSPNPIVILPGDITIKLGNTPATGFSVTELSDVLFGVSSSGIPIQSFSMSVDLPREDLRSIGYVLPVDRRINFPVFAKINLSSLIGDSHTGSLIDILNENKSHDLLITMYNPGCGSNKDIAIQYKIKNAKLENVNYDYNLTNNLVGNFSFTAEIDVNNPSKGIFISGAANNIYPEFPFNYLLLGTDQTGFLQTPQYNVLITSQNFISPV